MEIHADFSERVVVHSDKAPWQPSPMKGVDRRMLDRIGGEVARATTIVRYAAGSKFSAHTHSGGEEFIVLDGVFQDEHGDYPAGTYVRNPPTTSHTPGSDQGCVIFVKLWQFQMDDRNQFRVDMATVANGTQAVLHRDAQELVTYYDLKAGAPLDIVASGGAEMLVLAGSLTESTETLYKGTWLRTPDGADISAVSGEAGAKIWVKTGHLPFAKAPQV